MNIETSGAAVEIKGNGDVVIELGGSNTVRSGENHAGVEKNTIAATDSNPGSGNGNLTITDETGTSGSLNATGGMNGSGIGGGQDGNGSNITITGNAEVTAIGINIGGAGIGGGNMGTGSDITVSGDAQVKAQGGRDRPTPSFNSYGSGAAIGNGGILNKDGTEVAPNTDALTPNGKIEYYAPTANMETDAPIKTVIGTYVLPQPTEPAQPAPLYRVIDQDGKALACETERKDGVLTITVDADFAALTGALGGIQTLKAQGIDTIVFVTKAATSTFALFDLLSQSNTGDSYTLTHDGSTVTFTLGAAKTDVSGILAQP